MSASKLAECGVPQSQLPQRTPGQTRQARGGRRGPPGGARAGPGAHCGVGPAWVLEIISNQKPSPMSCPAHRIGLTSLSKRESRVSASLRPAQSPAAAGRWKGHPVARAAVRPAAPVRLGRGEEPPGLISPSGVPSPLEFDKLLLWTDMSNPDDDTDVPSGFNDDAEMERTSLRTSEMQTPTNHSLTQVL